MADVEIAVMTPTHIGEVHDISLASFPVSWSREDLLKEVYSDNSLNLVALEDGKVAGYINIWYVYDEADVINVAVREDSRKRGIGRKLMLEAIVRLMDKGITDIYLEVRVSNLPAQSLYRALGFNAIGVRRKYYSNGEDAYNMHLEIKAQKPR
ncbi:ribosomal protein S18-alanine N-acetyltransferase [Youngiibacter fragilis]|uniref:[Ribosomal protein bS18]-alanine N-acetyltransferase n=1 Tax=Youngiibacter fragilis 232.1 TaxID=994573 RepID=V7HZ27_9CLOT|nr:ribosomal protein S18-alanine N-acetyltransferase [Youngiibacter fragilis]ETA79225.1 alanine acetyltransferase [Youngiibacter fragilis 232.1]